MLRGELLADLTLTVDDFFSSTYGTIYGVMRDVWESRGEVDIAMVGDRVERKGVPRDVFAECAKAVATPAHGASFAAIVKTRAKARRLLEEAGRLAAEAEGTSDPDALARESSERIAALLDSGISTSGMDITESANAVLQDLASGEGRIPGLDTGYPLLDYKTLGLKPGELWIVAGRPSMGKSSFSNNIAWNLASRGKKVAIFSLEVDRSQLVRNIVSIATGIRLRTLVAGQAVDPLTYQRAVERVAPLLAGNLHVSDDGRVTPGAILSQCRTLKRQKGLDLVIVDYIQLCEMGGKGKRHEDVGAISRGLKLMARDLGVPVIALSQLNRNLENREEKRPRLADLRESGSLEQDADVVIGLFRPWVYTKLSSEERDAEAIILKQRNGPLGTVKLDFDAETVSFHVPPPRTM